MSAPFICFEFSLLLTVPTLGSASRGSESKAPIMSVLIEDDYNVEPSSRHAAGGMMDEELKAREAAPLITYIVRNSPSPTGFSL